MPAYTMKGLHAEVRSKFHNSVENYIVVSRILQGQADLGVATVQEQRDIVARFKSNGDAAKGLATLKADEIEKQKQEATVASQGTNRPVTARDAELVGPVPDSPPKTGFWETKNLSFDERKKLQAAKDAWKKKKATEAAGVTASTSSTSIPSHTSAGGFAPEDEEMERAIRESVAQTSHGDPNEDAQIEAQIRASVVEMRRIAAEKRSQEQSSRGAAPSQPSATPEASSSSAPTDVEGITDEEFEALVAEAARQSMLTAQQQTGSGPQHGGREGEEEQHGVTISINDEALRQALLESQRNAAAAGTGQNEELDEQLRKAIEASERDHQAQLARHATERSEEEIIMEYVKKQSLAEEEFRRKGKGPADAPKGKADGDDDEELKRAMEESLRVSGRSGGPSGSA